MTQPNLKRRLLLLACSQRKQSTPEPLPAIDRYDGPMFRTLRKYLRQELESARTIDVFVLSARYGLINGTTPTMAYDQRMSSARAAALQPNIHAELQHLFDDHVYWQMFIGLGKDYVRALDHVEQLIPSHCAVTIAAGSHGQRQAMLYRWLYGQPSKFDSRTKPTNVIRLRGKTIMLSATQALDIARQSLATGLGNPANFQYWYVEIDGQKVSAKWLVSQIAGLPIGAFGAQDARRVLSALGIEVCSL